MSAFRSLRYRDYRLLWLGAIVSNTGTWMQNVALSWYVLELTGSAFWVGAVNFANFVPMWFSPIGGVLADRFDRRKILLITQSSMGLSAAVLATFASVGRASLAPVMLLTLATGLAFSVDAPTRQAYFPSLVPRESMVNAIALNSAQFSLARVVGPAVAGAVIASVGVVPLFWINAASFVTVIGALWAVRQRAQRRVVEGGARARLRQGLAYAWRHPLARMMIASIAVLSLFAGPISALLPVFAREVFGRGPRAFGFLTAALGTGSVLGAVALGRAGRVRPAMIAAGLVLSAAALIAFAAVGSFSVGLGLMLLFGGAYLFTVSATNSQIQTTVDDAVRGRVISLFMVAFGGLFPVGALIAGTIADRVGVQATTIGGAAICAVWGLSLLWRLRARGAPVEPAPEPGLTPQTG